MTGKPGQRPWLLWAAESGRLLLGFGVLAVLARMTGANVLGDYLAVVSVATLIPRLLDLGLPLAVGYFLRLEPQALRACSRLLARHVLGAVPAAALLAAGMAWFPFEGATASELAASHWPQVALLVIAELLMLLGLAAFIPTTRFKAYFATIVLPPGLMLVGLGAHAAMLPGRTPTAGDLLNMLAGASVLASFVMVAAVRRATRQGSSSALDTRSVYRYGLRSYGSALAKILAQRFDRPYLSTVLGPASFAQYSLAVSIRDMVAFPANLFALTLRNRQIDLIGRHRDVRAARRLLMRVSALWTLLGLAAAALLLPLWPWLVTVGFGSTMRPAAQYLEVLAFSCAPMAVMSFSWNHLYALNHPGRVTALTVASLAFAVPIFWAFIAWTGPGAGVAYATVTWSAAGAAGSLAWALTSEPDTPPDATGEVA